MGERDIVSESTTPLMPTAVCTVTERNVGVTEMPSGKEKGIVPMAFPPSPLQLSVRNASEKEGPLGV